MSKTTKHLESWIETLSEEQVREALLTCVEHMIETEDLRFYPDDKGDSRKAPYWESCGEPLIEI